MQKIIKYVGLTSQTFKLMLQNLRSQPALLSKGKMEGDEWDFLLDLDLIDVGFLDLILDVLENFKIYKLCIFVCNRYRMVNRLGRYLVAIGMKYSPIAIETNKIVKSLSPYLMQAQLEKSYIAHSALHSVLENMEPSFLPPALLPSVPSLLLLGYRKSIALLLSREISIELTRNFGDFALARSLAEKILGSNNLEEEQKNNENNKQSDLKQLIETLANEERDWNNSGLRRPEKLSDLGGIVLTTMTKLKNLMVLTSESKNAIKNLCLKFGVRVLDSEVFGFLGENRVLVDRKSTVFNYFLERNVKMMPVEIDYGFFLASYDQIIPALIEYIVLLFI